jgi:dienelactone hydrolase
MIHEIYGLTDWACDMADELAAEGYIVIAPDLLTGSATNGGGNVGNAVQALPPAQMKAAGKTYKPVTYDGTGHGFIRAGEAPDANAANKKARDAAFQRTVELLKKI